MRFPINRTLGYCLTPTELAQRWWWGNNDAHFKLGSWLYLIIINYYKDYSVTPEFQHGLFGVIILITTG